MYRSLKTLLLICLFICSKLSFSMEEEKPLSSLKNCRICNVKSKNKCSKCKVAYYCSIEHQKEHWPTHEAECKKICSIPQRLTEEIKDNNVSIFNKNDIDKVFSINASIIEEPENLRFIHSFVTEFSKNKDAFNDPSFMGNIYTLSLAINKNPAQAFVFALLTSLHFSMVLNDLTYRAACQHSGKNLNQEKWLYELFSLHQFDLNKLGTFLMKITPKENKDNFPKMKLSNIPEPMSATLNAMNLLINLKNLTPESACFITMFLAICEGNNIHKINTIIDNAEKIYEMYDPNLNNSLEPLLDWVKNHKS